MREYFLFAIIDANQFAEVDAAFFRKPDQRGGRFPVGVQPRLDGWSLYEVLAVRRNGKYV